MNRFAAIAALLTPAIYAADSSGAEKSWIPDAVEAARGVVQGWQKASDGIANELQFFHSSLPPVGNSTALPESENGDAVIVCDRGLLFDAKNSRLVYVGNVRMRDTRLTLHARNELYLHLEELSNNSGKKDKQTGAKTTASKKPTAPAAKPTPATEKSVSPPAVAADKPAAKPSAPAVSTPQEVTVPLHIETGSAEANVVDNRIILFSAAGEAPIVLTRGEDTLIAKPSATAPARILADSAGNILIEGEEIYISYTDAENGKSTVRTKDGLAYYHAANNTLNLTGDIQLTHPDGKLNCTESLRLVLTPAEQTVPAKEGFMSQFTGMRLTGVSAAEAKGNVVAETRGVNGSRPGSAQGDMLVYNGITGDCSITGADSRLTYGEHNTIYANEGIHLLPNGDIELRGTNIHGTYERPSQQDKTAVVRGSFQSGDNIIFTAETSQITTPNGLTATDSELDFSCTGAVKLTMERKESTAKPDAKKGIPNIAIAEYSDITAAEANGQVRAKRLAGGKVISSMEGEQAVINMKTGSALLTGGAETPAVMVHESNRIVATPGDTPAVLNLKENGDIILTGKDITATLKGKNGLTTAKGQHSMTLYRAENRIESGGGVTITAPSAIITTKGPLSAILQPDETEKSAPSGSSGFSRHAFNYIGIKSADTKNGGTVRTEKGSMQCSGSIHVTMNPEAGENHEMAGVQHAVANGNVMLLTKDSNNQMIRAIGDRLTVNGETGMKSLTGREVILENENNRHTVSGKGATVHVDKKNKVRISGEKHDTQVTKLREQSAKQKQNNSKPKNK